MSSTGTMVLSGQAGMFLHTDGEMVITGSQTYINDSSKGYPNDLCPELQMTALDQAVLDDDPDTDAGLDEDQLARLQKRSNATSGSEVDSDNTPPSDIEDAEEVDVSDITKIDYEQQLTDDWYLKDVTIAAAFPHHVVEQAGFTDIEIVQNLKVMATNTLQVVSSKYGRRNILVTSGFRPGSGRSQHERGQAVDIQFPTKTNDEIYEIAQWIRDNVAYDQMILEYGGNRPWIHMSSINSSQRRQILTRTRPGVYKGGLIKVA